MLERAEIGAEVGAEDDASLAFAARRGFREWALEVEHVRELTGAETEPPLPAGLEVVSLDERPELWTRPGTCSPSGYEDLPLPAPVMFTLEQWLREDSTDPRGIRSSRSSRST